MVHGKPFGLVEGGQLRSVTVMGWVQAVATCRSADDCREDASLTLGIRGEKFYSCIATEKK
jgi:hypothetical protein